MGGILGGLTDILFGKPKVPKMDINELTKLIDLGINKNRYDTQGPFTSQTWNADKSALTQSVDPSMQSGLDALLARVNTGSPGFDGAGRFDELMAAYEASQQESPQQRYRERPPPQERRPPPQSGYFKRFGDEFEHEPYRGDTWMSRYGPQERR